MADVNLLRIPYFNSHELVLGVFETTNGVKGPLAVAGWDWDIREFAVVADAPTETVIPNATVRVATDAEIDSMKGATQVKAENGWLYLWLPGGRDAASFAAKAKTVIRITGAHKTNALIIHTPFAFDVERFA